jgi:glycosyltransferase involved in cell wall biosynthesis
MIQTFNCAQYLTQTLQSVLEQDPGAEHMQIQVVDDHSTQDDPEAVVRKMGHGRVEFYRQSCNVGITENFATCLQNSRGRLVHLLHGDDYVLDGFYERMQRGFDADARIGAAFCRHYLLADSGRTISTLEQEVSGVLDNWLQRLASEQRIMTPSMVVRREVYEAVGGFDARLICSEDWEMWVRIAARYPIWYEAQPLAVYRMHSHSNTGRHVRTAEDMRYTRAAIDMFADYLPAPQAAAIVRGAKQTYALSALRMARVLLEQRDLQGFRAQFQEALRLSRSAKVLSMAAWSVLLGVLRRRRVPGEGQAWHPPQ